MSGSYQEVKQKNTIREHREWYWGIQKKFFCEVGGRLHSTQEGSRGRRAMLTRTRNVIKVFTLILLNLGVSLKERMDD